MSVPNYVFSLFSFIGFVLCCIPFAWHLEAWNVGTCIYMFWTASGCLVLFINSIIWNGNAYDWAPVYCDITTKWLMGVTIGIPVASLCINRRLYHIASVRSITTGPGEKRRAVAIDLAIGLGIPVLVMALHYAVQGHRYNIYEDVGCFPFIWNVSLTFPLIYGPPLYVGIASAIYAVLSIRAFWQTRSQMNEFLGSGGHRNLNSSRYFRLMLLAAVEILCTLPLATYNIVVSYQNGVIPYKGWVHVHAGWHRVDQYPAIIWRHAYPLSDGLEKTRWLVVVCAFVFFAFFGFADEAMKNYRSAARTISKTIGLSTAGEATFNGAGSKSKGFGASNGTLPSFVRREARKRNSLDSISDTSSQNGEKDKEKHVNLFNPDFSYGALTLNDVGGVLADPSPSSESASSSNVITPIDVKAPAFPPLAVTRTSTEIEESSRTSPTPITHGIKANTPDMV